MKHATVGHRSRIPFGHRAEIRGRPEIGGAGRDRPPVGDRGPAGRRPLGSIRARLGLALGFGLGLLGGGPGPASLSAQSEDAGEATRQRASGQVHRTIRRAGRGPLPRAVHGVRIGTTTAAVAGRGVRLDVAPVRGAFGPPARSRGGLGGGRRGIGILPGLPRHLVHGPLVAGPGVIGVPRIASGFALIGPPWLAAAATVAALARPSAREGRYIPPPPEPGPPLPPAAQGPRGACGVATVRMAAGVDRTLRIATGPLGAETPSAAETVLEARVRRGAPVVLRGWDEAGLIVPGGLVREVSVVPCGEGS